MDKTINSRSNLSCSASFFDLDNTLSADPRSFILPRADSKGACSPNARRYGFLWLNSSFVSRAESGMMPLTCGELRRMSFRKSSPKALFREY
jgi:hypothetical protein